MSGPGGLDGLGAIAAVARGAATGAALLSDAAARAEALEPDLGALVHTAPETPADDGDSDLGPLAGLVLGVKEIISVEGLPRTCGAPHFVDDAARSQDATAVARLREAGAAVLGTLSSHVLAFGVIGPATANPAVPGRIAGGSSSGSAAAVAAGLVHAALGSDTGGSVRIPAACCGVVGLKPTRGSVSLAGVAALAWSLDTVGAIAATVADCRLVSEVIRGYDPTDPASDPNTTRSDAPTPAEVRIGVLDEIHQEAIDPQVRTRWEAALEALEADGARLVPVRLPSFPEANEGNGLILCAEAAAVHGEQQSRWHEALPADVVRRLELGSELDAVTTARARRLGTLLTWELRAAFRDVDVLVLPTLPCRVPVLGRRQVAVGDDKEPVTAALTRFTGAWNLVGAPAGSVPTGVDDEGAPIGMQVVGPWHGEGPVLDVMTRLEALDLRGH